jgi:cobalamin synthase
MTPLPADPTWRRRASWLLGACFALVLLAVFAAPRRWFGVPLLLSGLAALAYGVILLRDVGGVGSDEGARSVANHNRYLARLPFQRELPASFAARYRRLFAVTACLLGTVYVAMATAVLLGLQSRDIQ